jgi:Zn-dependent protease with chaperone function
MGRFSATIVLAMISFHAFAARDWQAWCGYEDCPSGTSSLGLVVWVVFLVAGLIGAAREGWKTLSLVIVWLLLIGLTSYGWFVWKWHWLPLLVVVSALWWWPSVTRLLRAQRDNDSLS